nr:metal ABC transporter ATP-binding protein [Candidatus Finniella inopinata]
MTCLIRLEGVTYQQQNKTIVEGINLQVDLREIITIIGPNGAGKTTLLKIILGLIQPTAGTVWRSRPLQIGYMPQRIDINPLLPLTVKGLLELSQPTPIHKRDLKAALELVRGHYLINQSLQTLSGGEWQRVLLARALLRQPNLLVLDEPAQGVDIIGQTEFYQLLANLRTQLNCAIVLVSHDLHLVMAATDKVICLNRHICCSGHPEMVMNDPHYQKLFGVDLNSSIVPYIHHHDHRHDGHNGYEGECSEPL